MKWTRVRIKTITEAEDIIISDLYDYGFEGAQIEDKIPLSPLEKEQMFVDILPEIEPDDGVAYLNFFIEQDNEKDIASMIETAKEELEELREFMDIGDGTITVDETEDLDWINNWKQFFHQFYIDDLLVIPSWEEIPAEAKDKMVLHIDPGTAFGTGMHETTQLCIRQMKKYLTQDTELLDVGTGSGILAILALMYGAKHCVGTDLDPCAVEAVANNMADNNISKDEFRMMIGNIIDDRSVQDSIGYECYDIVMANILAPVLVELAPVIVNHLKIGGVFITSGIIEGKEESVIQAMEKAGLTIVEVTAQGKWRNVTARRDK